jgi:hypothetical protein
VTTPLYTSTPYPYPYSYSYSYSYSRACRRRLLLARHRCRRGARAPGNRQRNLGWWRVCYLR